MAAERVARMTSPKEQSTDDLMRSITEAVRREVNTDTAPVQVSPNRFVTTNLFATISGYSANAIRIKISRGTWVEGREFVRAPDGTIMVDREGVERWILSK